MNLTGLYRYPVKSLRGGPLDAARVELIGLEADRRWLVVDETGVFQTIRQIPDMTQVVARNTAAGIAIEHAGHGSCAVSFPKPDAPGVMVTIWKDSVPARLADPAAGAFLSAVLGKSVRLAWLADPAARGVDQNFGGPEDRVSFADGYPMLLTSTSSLANLDGRLGTPLSMHRFRPNLVISGAEPWAEDHWQLIRIGSVRFRVVKPCARCVIVTRDPETGAQAERGEPLKTLGSFHRAANGGIIFGQNLIPDETGEIRIGDRVEILRAGPSNLL